MKIIIFIIMVGSIFPIGDDGFYFPTNARSYSLHLGSLALPINPSVNPAILSGVDTELVSFSYNSWVGDIKGQNLMVIIGSKRKNLVEFTRWSIEGLELRDETPTDDPLGYFGSTFLNANFATSINLNKYNSIGIAFGLYDYSLYDREVFGSNIKIGYYQTILSRVNFGFVLSGFGFSIDNKTFELENDPILSLGASYTFNEIGMSIMFDTHLLFTSTNINKSNVVIGAIKSLGPIKLYLSKLVSIHNDQIFDFSLGADLRFNDWVVKYGTQIDLKNVLGHVQSIELVYNF